MVKGFQGDSGLHLPHFGVACYRLDLGAARRQRNVASQRYAQRELVVGSHRIDGRISVCAIMRIRPGSFPGKLCLDPGLKFTREAARRAYKPFNSLFMTNDHCCLVQISVTIDQPVCEVALLADHDGKGRRKSDTRGVT